MQSSVFRTFQGWLAMSQTAPTEGTLRVFPDVLLSNAYIILRPFMRPKHEPVSENPLDVANWEFGAHILEYLSTLRPEHMAIQISRRRRSRVSHRFMEGM